MEVYYACKRFPIRKRMCRSKMPPKKKIKISPGQTAINTYLVDNNNNSKQVVSPDSVRNKASGLDRSDSLQPEPSSSSHSQTSPSAVTTPTKDLPSASQNPPQDTQSGKSKRPRKIMDYWFKIWPWLSSNGNALFCKPCIETKKKNVFATDGCRVFKTSSITRHETSEDHKSSVQVPDLATGFVQAFEHLHSAQDKAILKCITLVLWLASENVPLANFDKMFNLFKDLEVPELEPLQLNERVSYSSYYTRTEILGAISTVIDIEIDKKITKSPYITVLADESTDLANKKRMTLNARIIDPSTCVPETVFLSDQEYDDGSGLSLANVILQELEKRGVSVDKLVGFGSDGASVMSGSNKGVRGILMQKQPHLIHVHCMAHRLALSTSQAAECVKPSIKNYQEWLTSIYYYFSKSSSREQELHKIQDVLESSTLKYKEIHAVRWLSIYQAVEAVYRTVDPLITYLHQRQAAKDPKAKGLLKKMATLEFVFITYLLMDSLAIVSRLCLTFQEQDLDIATAKLAVDRCLSDLEVYKNGTQLFPTHLEHFETDVSLDDSGQHVFKGTGHILTVTQTNLPGVKSSFVNALISNIRNRFPQKDLVDAFFVLGMRGINMGNDQSAKEFGNEEIDRILQHFGEEKIYKGTVAFPKVQKAVVVEQWSRAKEIVRSIKYPVDRFGELWQLLATHHKDELDQLIRLAQIAMLLPLHTADCERTFSQQNKILTKMRANLSSKHLDELIRVRIFTRSGGTVNKQNVLEAWKTFKSIKLYVAKL